MTRSTDVPYPPLQLASRVCSLEGQPSPLADYEQRGVEARAGIEALLPDEWSWRDKRVLDFGCGAGRTLRHFLAEAADKTELHGSDIDEPSIAWLQANLCPPLHVGPNGAAPPLAQPDASLDLIWALSVFTHLPDPLPWLVELHRALKPGGLLLATYMGRYNGEWFTHAPWQEDRIGMTVLRPDQGWDVGGPMVLMSDWWVRAHWGRAFEVLSSAPVHGQTWVMLRKRDVPITVAQLAQPADDPREHDALRYSVELVQRDRARSLAEQRAYYEASRSWRVTRPLRLAAAYVRDRRARAAA